MQLCSETSEYIGLDESETMEGMRGNGLNAMHFNIRGLVNKVNELENILASANEQGVLVQVILLCKTLLRDMNEKFC
jgi:hypothetical protein